MFFIGTFLGGSLDEVVGDVTGNSASNNARDNNSGSFWPNLVNLVVSNATGSNNAGNFVETLIRGQQALGKIPAISEHYQNISLGERLGENFLIGQQVVPDLIGDAIGEIMVPDPTGRFSHNRPSGGAPSGGAPSGGSPGNVLNQGNNSDGSIPNNSQTPFQDQGFGSEYDAAYNIIQQITNQNNEWSASQAQLQRDWQEMMSNTAHQREVADLQAAGLNPVLSAGGSGASTPTGAMGQTDTSNTRLVGELALHAIDGLANTAQGLSGLHSQTYGDNLWGRLENFYDNSRLGNRLINWALNTVGDLVPSFRYSSSSYSRRRY